MSWDALMDMSGEREPLVTVGEAHAVVRLLEPIADGDSADAGLAGELRVRLAMRLPVLPYSALRVHRVAALEPACEMLPPDLMRLRVLEMYLRLQLEQIQAALGRLEGPPTVAPAKPSPPAVTG